MEAGNISPLKKESVIRLPGTITNEFNDKLSRITKDKHEDGDLPNFIHVLLDPHSKKHLDVLKKITQNLGTYTSSSLWPLLLEIVINGLYYCHSNHTIKSSLNGLIRHLPDKDLSLVSSLVQGKMTEMNGVELIAALMQSDFGCKVICNHIDFVVNFFTTFLNYLSTEVQQLKPTTEIAKLHSNIRSLSRTLLSIFKLIQINSITEQLLNSIILVLNLKGIPLEVQGNCSKILFLLVKQQKHGLKCIFEKITMEKDHTFSVLAPLENTASVRLNLSIALLTSLEVDELLVRHPPFGTMIGGVILPILLNFSNGLNETELALLTARFVEQWQRKCYECFVAHHSPLLAGEWNAASDRLLEIMLNGLEHQIDVVRHTSKEAFLYNLKTYVLLKSDVGRILKTILGMPRFKKSKYMALACIAKTELFPVLLHSEHKLAEELLHVAKDVDLSSQAKEVFNLLMFQKMEHTDEWMTHWFYPLLNAMEKHPNGQSFESSLVDLLKLHPEMIYNVETWCQVDCPSRLAVYITALLACRKLGLFATDVDAPQEKVWNNAIKVDVLEHALNHYDGKLRLNALGVIVEGPKTSQLYSPLEIEWIRQFISRNMVNPNAAFRQQFCSYVKKFLLKLKNGGLSLTNRNDTIVSHYQEFVTWIISKCLADLGPASSFSRRFLSLQFLKLIHETIGLETNPNGLNVTPCLGLSAVSSLVDCFFDSYDVNKDLALELLQSPFFITLINQDAKGDELIDFYWESSLTLSQSLRSCDTVAAGFLFRWLIHLKISKIDVQVQPRNVWSPKTSRTFVLMNQLVRMLKGQVDAARGNLGRLAIDAPMYGLLSSIRLFLRDQQFRDDGMKDESWESIHSDVIDVCFEASAIASPVVTCDSPEGFLPDTSNFPSPKLNAQTLLVSAWRTVKEVALLFGQMSSWMLGPNFRPLKDNGDVILKMGLHLKQLLLETKHRGAFEQVYCGFSQLSYALWKSSQPEFHKLPASWLLNIVSDLKDNESAAKLCATRRSAGLPFIFQAVLSPEVEIGNGKLFASTIESLLEIAANEKASECRIHALNILRNLYRESRLNQVIGPYVARGLILSISGFEAPDWSERNSSTLLFSALMTRIFGVPKSKNDFQRKNSLTGRVFFQLYPSLYPFLLERLGSCVADIENDGIHLHPSLFPMLVLLGRLHPSTCEMYDSAFRLEPFICLVRACGSSPVLKTRQLAAQALTPLLTPTAFASLLPKLLDSIAKCTYHNALHGILLQVNVKESNVSQFVKEEHIHYFVKDVQQWAEALHVFQCLNDGTAKIVVLLSSCCHLIRYESSEILKLLIESFTLQDQSDIVLQACLSELRCRNPIFHSEPFYPLSCQKLTALAMSCKNYPDATDARELLNHPLSEVRMETLQNLGVIDSNMWPQLKSIISDENESIECRIKALDLTTRFDSDQNQLKWLLQLYRDEMDDTFRCTALAVAGRVLYSTNTSNISLLLEWSSYLVESVQSTSIFRHMVVETLTKCPEMLQIDKSFTASKEHAVILSNMWMCLLYCLIDDEESIRTAAAAAACGVCTGYWKQVQSGMAIEKALEYLVDYVGSYYSMEVVTLLSSMVLEEDEQPEGDSQSFESGDSDVFREPLIISMLFCRYIERCVKQNAISSSDSIILAGQLENRWKILGNCDTLTVDSLISKRRSVNVYIVGVVKLFLLTKSLQSVNADIAVLHRCIHNCLEQFNLHWSTYSIQQFVYQLSM